MNLEIYDFDFGVDKDRDVHQQNFVCAAGGLKNRFTRKMNVT
jgi:hypothetical protein